MWFNRMKWIKSTRTSTEDDERENGFLKYVSCLLHSIINMDSNTSFRQRTKNVQNTAFTSIVMSWRAHSNNNNKNVATKRNRKCACVYNDIACAHELWTLSILFALRNAMQRVFFWLECSRWHQQQQQLHQLYATRYDFKVAEVFFPVQDANLCC